MDIFAPIGLDEANEEIAKCIKINKPARDIFKVIGTISKLDDDLKEYYTYSFNTFVFDKEDILKLAEQLNGGDITHVVAVLGVHCKSTTAAPSGRTFKPGSPTVILAGAHEDEKDKKYSIPKGAPLRQYPTQSYKPSLGSGIEADKLILTSDE